MSLWLACHIVINAFFTFITSLQYMINRSIGLCLTQIGYQYMHYGGKAQSDNKREIPLFQESHENKTPTQRLITFTD